MHQQGFEEEAIALFRKHIEHYCIGRWINIEPEDRLSEAMLTFCQALRTFPLDKGRFWPSYIRMLHGSLDELNRATPSPYFGRHLSLDKQYHVGQDGALATMLDFLPGPADDDTLLGVASFLRALTGQQRLVLNLLYKGVGKKQIAACAGCTLAQLRAMRAELAEMLLSGQWVEDADQ